MFSILVVVFAHYTSCMEMILCEYQAIFYKNHWMIKLPHYSPAAIIIVLYRYMQKSPGISCMNEKSKYSDHQSFVFTFFSIPTIIN